MLEDVAGIVCTPGMPLAGMRLPTSMLPYGIRPHKQVETLLGTKADVSDMERRALKTEVDASLRTQMSDLYTLLRSKAEDSEFKVGRGKGRWVKGGWWWRGPCSAGLDGDRVGRSA